MKHFSTFALLLLAVSASGFAQTEKSQTVQGGGTGPYEAVVVGEDVYQHPGTTMDENAEFLTNRPLKVKMICEL